MTTQAQEIAALREICLSLLKSNEQLRQEVERLKKEASEAADEQRKEKRPQCGICLVPYEEEGLACPRILECGHTLCEACGERCAERFYHVQCPYDRHMTLLGCERVKGLPKNYALLG